MITPIAPPSPPQRPSPPQKAAPPGVKRPFRLADPTEIRLTIFWSNKDVFNKYQHGKKHVHLLLRYAEDALKKHNLFLNWIPNRSGKPQPYSKFVLNYPKPVPVHKDFEEIPKSGYIEIDEFEQQQVTFINELQKLRAMAHKAYRDDAPKKLPSRLPVIFCEFDYTSQDLRTYPTVVTGQTMWREIQLGHIKWLPYVVINLNRDYAADTLFSNTLAHEIGHAATDDHNERDKQDIMYPFDQGTAPAQTYYSQRTATLIANAYFAGKK